MSTQRGRATSVMQLVGSRAKEALRAAEESLSKVEYQKNFELTKVKAQTIFAQVQESVAAKRGKSVDGKHRSKSAGPASKPAEEDLISNIMDALYGVSPVAARLALSKCEGIAKIHKIDVACNWLLEEKNRDEIEAAENEEIERSIADQNAPPSDVSGETPANEELLPRARNRSPCKRRFSKGSDDGCGLGFFMTRKSLTPQKAGAFCPSPRKVPHPGRLSNRALSESARPRPSTGSVESGAGEDRPPLARRVSIGSQTSTASEEFHPAMTPRGGDGPEKDLSMVDEGEGSKAGFQNPFLQRCEGDQDQVVQAMPPKEHQEVASVGRDDDEDAPVIEEEESESEDEDAMAPLVSDPLPPASQCWDWPLSRHEKKARVQMLERRMNAMDHLSLKKECKTLRGHLRKASMGGSSVASSRAPSIDPSGRPSRLSM